MPSPAERPNTLTRRAPVPITRPAIGRTGTALSSIDRSAPAPITPATGALGHTAIQRAASTSPILSHTTTQQSATAAPLHTAIQHAAITTSTLDPVPTSPATTRPAPSAQTGRATPVQRAVPVHRPTAPTATPLPLPLAFRAPAAAPPIQRAAGLTSFLTAAATDQVRDTRQRFNDTVDDQFGGFADKIADVRDAAALIRDPSQLRQVVKQRGLDMIADSNPIAGSLLGYRRGESEADARGGGAGHVRRGRGEHQEMEQLAEKLVAPLARLLRTELRMDRERMGRLRDSGR